MSLCVSLCVCVCFNKSIKEKKNSSLIKCCHGFFLKLGHEE